ncbi:MAG: hypothetical protein EKK55_20170 [Rhodocyclaceae bacterium]|nr:MAG: hypothetical protein EKK55_20170 [Rhodocyclaceae bacterium]
MSAAENYVPESGSHESARAPKQGLIPEGDYPARGARPTGELGETMKGSAYVRVVLRITEGEYAGRQLTKDLYFTDKTWERSIKALQAMGWKGQDISQVDGLDQNDVSITIEEKVQTDRDGAIRTDPQGNAIYRNEVAWINGGVQRMEAAKKLSFVEEMKAKIAQLAANEGAAPAAPKGSSAAEKLKAKVAERQAAKKVSAKTVDAAPVDPPIEESREPGSDDDIPF